MKGIASNETQNLIMRENCKVKAEVRWISTSHKIKTFWLKEKAL